MNRLADVVLILTCLAVGAFVIGRQVGPTPPSNVPASYEVGEAVGALGGIDFSTHAATVVLYLQTDCRYCSESMEFYRRLDARLGHRPEVSVVVVGGEEETSLRGYVKEHKFSPDDVRTLAIDGAKFLGSPTLLVVKKDGSVAGEWRGLLNSKAEDQVLTLAEELAQSTSK